MNTFSEVTHTCIYVLACITAYNDSAWTRPVTLGAQGDSPWNNSSFEVIKERAKWVWTSDGAEQIYCRMSLCMYRFHLNLSLTLYG